jgi:hypothetical protein
MSHVQNRAQQARRPFTKRFAQTDEGTFYDGPPPSGHSTVAINGILSLTVSMLPSVHTGEGLLTTAICVASVPTALVLGRVASSRNAFLARVIPASFGSVTILINAARQGSVTLTAATAAISVVFALTGIGKVLFARYGKPEQHEDPLVVELRTKIELLESQLATSGASRVEVLVGPTGETKNER